MDIALLPSATFFREGEQMRLDVQGRWFSSRNPLFGQAPAAYEHSPRGFCALHCGGEHGARLRVPLVPPQTSSNGGVALATTRPVIRAPDRHLCPYLGDCGALAEQVEVGKIRYSFPDHSTTNDKKSYARGVVSVVKS